MDIQNPGSAGLPLEAYRQQAQSNQIQTHPLPGTSGGIGQYVPPVQPCPSCGHCPTCGHHRPNYYPYIPSITWIGGYGAQGTSGRIQSPTYKPVAIN